MQRFESAECAKKKKLKIKISVFVTFFGEKKKCITRNTIIFEVETFRDP